MQFGEVPIPNIPVLLMHGSSIIAIEEIWREAVISRSTETEGCE